MVNTISNLKGLDFENAFLFTLMIGTYSWVLPSLRTPTPCLDRIVKMWSLGFYTSLAWRNKSFENGILFACAPDSNTYAVLGSKVKLKVYENNLGMEWDVHEVVWWRVFMALCLWCFRLGSLEISLGELMSKRRMSVSSNCFFSAVSLITQLFI